MTTALDIIKRSMRLLGVYSIGEEPSASESQDCLAALNTLVEEMSLGNMVYAKTLDTITLAANVPSITVGPTGTTVTARPVEVLDESYIVLSDVSFPLSVVTLQLYNAIPVKDNGGIPRVIWPQMDMPDITLTLYPVPSETMTLNLWSNKVIGSFPALTTQVILPPGYEKGLAFMLAEDMAPEFDINPLPAAVLRGASRARRLIKRVNLQVPTLALPVIMLGGGYVNWQDGA